MGWCQAWEKEAASAYMCATSKQAGNTVSGPTVRLLLLRRSKATAIARADTTISQNVSSIAMECMRPMPGARSVMFSLGLQLATAALSPPWSQDLTENMVGLFVPATT
jgi:hypothetical protein